MPKVDTKKKTSPQKRKRKTGDDEGLMLKELLGTQVYEDVMEDPEEEEEEELFSSFQEGQDFEEEEEEEEQQEDDDEEDDEEVEASQVIPRRSPRKKKQVVIPGTEVSSSELPTITRRPRPTKKGLLLPEDVEDELIEWVETQPMMYDKSDSGYKMAGKKLRTWDAKAETLKEVGVHITGSELAKWFEKMCAIARKKKDQLPSGSGRDISAEKKREQSLKQKLQWLTPFLRREPGETPVRMKRPLATRAANAPFAPSQETQSSFDDEGPGFTSTPTTSQGPAPGPSGQSSRSHSSTSARRAAPRRTAKPATAETLGQQLKQYEDLIEQVISNLDTTVMPSHIRARKMFIDSLFMQVISQLPEPLWADFEEEFMRLISKYRRKHVAATLQAPADPDYYPPPPPSGPSLQLHQPRPSTSHQ